MATLTTRPETAHDLAEFLLRERDRCQRIAQEHADLPQIAARHQGQAEGYRTALAYLAGHVGLRTVEALELLVMGSRPAPADVDPTWTEPELRAAWGDR
jgi:hypothetical protein